VRTQQLAATERSEGMKHIKYKDIVEANGYEMIPFCMETYGGIGFEASTLLLRLPKTQRHFWRQGN
jgi:hypothetical protein